MTISYIHARNIFFWLFLPLTIFGQPEPCDDPPVMTPLCADACIICDIEGFTGINNGGSEGEAPPDFCTFVVHNARWIAFQAGSENLTIELSVSNCEMGNGLELAIYESLDCETFQLVSNCMGGTNSVDNGSSGIFQNTVPLVIGQYYYIVMDGNFGDICNWTFNVLEGTTEVTPLMNSGTILGDFDACPENEYLYYTTGEEGATIYDWTIDGTPIGEGDSIIISWVEEGVYDLCVTARNACDEAPPTCQSILVSSISPTILDEVICEGEVYMVNDSIELTTSGFYEYEFETAEGCDSVVYITLEVVPESSTDLAFNICEGDSIFIGNTAFFETGTYTETLTNWAGCDSTVYLDLGIIICEIEGEVTAFSPSCYGEATGELVFFVESGTPPFMYEWQQFDSTPSGNGMVQETNENVVIPGLPAGDYLITITDQFDNDVVLITQITDPPVLSASFLSSDYNGYDISCYGETDGWLESIPSGGVGPYTFEWSNDNNGALQEELKAGTYVVSVTDSYGCQIVLESILLQPDPLILDVLFQDPICDGPETGIIEVIGVDGGTGPYIYSLSGDSFISDGLYSDLSEGIYTLTVQDANTCQADTSSNLVAAVIPEIELGEDVTIELADEILLSPYSNIILTENNTFWSPPHSLSCTDCSETYARPFVTTTYYLEVYSEDDCKTVDSITVYVDARRRVFIPNAFSPDFNGINDHFLVFAGPEVFQVRTLKVFSRWGELVFENSNFQPNEVSLGWDGTFKGQLMHEGIYVWLAEVEFLDGLVELYEGDVTIIR